MTVKSPRLRPGVRATAAGMFTIGSAGEDVARMSKPPPKTSRSLKAFVNAPEVVAPTTSVKTTSVNIASVTPVRKRLRSGYAIDIRSTGARARMRPPVAARAPSRTSALYISVHDAPSTIIRPPSRKIDMLTFISPKSQRLIGSTNQSTSASPAPVCTARSGRPSSCRIGTRLRITSETPKPRTTASLEPTPETASAAPASSPSAAQSQPAPAALLVRRLGQVADRA